MADFGSSIVAYFGGDTSGLNKAIEGAEGMVNKFQRALGQVGLTIGAGAVIGFFKSVTDKYSQIQDMANALDMGTNALQSFGYAAKLAGVDVEMTQKMWQTARKSIDDLAVGNETATKTFAALGLSQKDLVGIPLDAALEKIARAYVANKDTAGAYAAMIEIVGGRSAKLMGVLEDLGVKGSKAFDDLARANGQLVGEDEIKRIDKFGDRIDTLKGSLMSAGGTVLNFFLKAAEGVGQAAAVWVNNIEGLKTDMDELEGGVKKLDTAAEKLGGTMRVSAAAQKKAAEGIAKQWETDMLNAMKSAEEQRKTSTDTLKAGDKIIALKKDIAVLEDNINKGMFTGKLLAEAQNVLVGRRNELLELANKLQTEMYAANEKWGKEQAAREEAAAKYLGIKKLSAEDLAEKQILEAKRSRGLTDEEAARLKIIILQGDAWKQIVVLEGILAVPVKERTKEGNNQLNLALQRIETIKTKIALLAGGVLPAEQAVTAEMAKQVALATERDRLANKAANDMATLTGGISPELISRASDAELQAMIDIKRRALLDRQASGAAMRDSDTSSLSILGKLSLENPMNAAIAELDKRSNLRRITETQGMQAGAVAYQTQYGGNALMFDAFYNSIKSNAAATDKTNNLLQNLSSQLAASGIFPAAPFGTGS